MGFFSELFNGIMNQSNDHDRDRDYEKKEPSAKEYIRFNEIEKDNYDEGQRNYIDEHGELPSSKE